MWTFYDNSLFNNNIDSMELWWCCDDILDQPYNFISMFSAKIIFKYNLVVFIEPCWSDQGYKIVTIVFVSFSEVKSVRFP